MLKLLILWKTGNEILTYKQLIKNSGYSFPSVLRKVEQLKLNGLVNLKEQHPIKISLTEKGKEASLYALQLNNLMKL